MHGGGRSFSGGSISRGGISGGTGHHGGSLSGSGHHFNGGQSNFSARHASHAGAGRSGTHHGNSGSFAGRHSGGNGLNHAGHQHNAGGSFAGRHGSTAGHFNTSGAGLHHGGQALGNHHGGQFATRHSTGYRHGGLNNGTGANHHGHNQWANHQGSGGNWNNGNWNGHHGNWNNGHWNGHHGGWNNWNNWGWNRAWNRGIFFSPFWGFYGLGGFGWGWPYYGGWGWGSPWGYNRFCGYGGFGYGGYGYGYPYSSYAYTAAYPDTTPVAVADQAQPPAADTAAAADSDFAAQGEAQFKAGDYAGAAKAWRHAIVDDSNNATLFLMMSQALFASGNYDESAGALQMGLMQMPEEQWGVVVENYKELYAPNDDYANQLKALEKSAKENPDDPARQVLLGYHYGYLGYPVQAVVKLNRTMQLAPQDMMAQKLREVMAAKAAAKGQAVEPAPKLPDTPAPVPGATPAGDDGGTAPAGTQEDQPSLLEAGPSLPQAAKSPES